MKEEQVIEQKTDSIDQVAEDTNARPFKIDLPSETIDDLPQAR